MLQSSSTEKINSADLDQIREILADALVDTKDAVVNLETAMMKCQPEFNKTQQDNPMGDMGNEVQAPNDEVATNQQSEANSGKPVLNEQKVKSQSELNSSEPAISNEAAKKSEPILAMNSQAELKTSKSNLADMKSSMPSMNTQIGIVGDDFKESINSLTKDSEIKNDFKKSDPALENEAKEQQEAVEISSSNASELV